MEHLNSSEKGRQGSANGKRWDDESVFAYIDTLGQEGLLASDRFVADFLVCDDLGNELADFIALQRNPLRIAFIHAKQAKGGSRRHQLGIRISRRVLPSGKEFGTAYAAMGRRPQGCSSLE
jgi:hypothetical protein